MGPLGEEARTLSPSVTSELIGDSDNLHRNYPLKKIQENNESEIMQTVLDDARDSYAEEVVVELRSETNEDLEGNVSRIVEWIEAWLRDNASHDGRSRSKEPNS
jgi:broad-specificity NMP kinase